MFYLGAPICNGDSFERTLTYYLSQFGEVLLAESFSVGEESPIETSLEVNTHLLRVGFMRDVTKFEPVGIEWFRVRPKLTIQTNYNIISVAVIFG
jgi:hypothetical protein